MLSGPLSGVTVLDLSIMAAGPWTGALLGELGADVIKVEPPAGDGTRWVHPLQRGLGTNYLSMNVNKRSMTLDLTDTEQRECLLSLVPDADVLVQNFSGGVVDRLGVGYRQVQPHNPRLIYCSISGFGSPLPLRTARAADYIIQAFSGFASGNGHSQGDFEQFRFTGFLDLSTAMVSVQAILAALLRRDSTGVGTHLDVAMVEAALEMQYTRVADYLGAGVLPVALGSDGTMTYPDGAFRTLDKYLFVTTRSDAEWQRLCDALERPDLAADERFASNTSRVEHREEVRKVLEECLAPRPAMWWIRALRRRNLCVGLEQDIDIFGNHVQVTSNEMIASVDSPWGRMQAGGLPWRFSQTPCEVTVPPEPSSHERLAFR